MTDLKSDERPEKSTKATALKHYLTWLSDILEQPVLSNDNFLDIGGHSMIAISLNERIRKEFGLVLSMEQLYNTTLENTFSAAE
jgi:acyl carrier protein